MEPELPARHRSVVGDRLVSPEPRAIARDLRSHRSVRLLHAADCAPEPHRLLRGASAGLQHHLVDQAGARRAIGRSRGSRSCSSAASIRTARTPPCRAAARRRSGRRATRCWRSPIAPTRRSSRRSTPAGSQTTRTIRPCTGPRRSTRRSSTKRCTRRRCSTCGIACRTIRSGSLRASGTSWRRRSRLVASGFSRTNARPCASPPASRRSAPIAIGSRSGGTTSSTRTAWTCRRSTSTCTTSPTRTSSRSSRPAGIATARCGRQRTGRGCSRRSWSTRRSGVRLARQ